MQIKPQLLNACKNNESSAQFELYKLCYGFMMSICKRYKQDDDTAAEALNKAFLKVLNNINDYRSEVPFDAWVKRIMINTLIDDYRREKKGKETVIITAIEESKYYNQYVDFNEADKNFDANELRELLKKLPKMSQKVFNLFAIDGYSHKEIADLLTISEGTSKWHVAFARKKLKAMLLQQQQMIKKKVING